MVGRFKLGLGLGKKFWDTFSGLILGWEVGILGAMLGERLGEKLG